MQEPAIFNWSGVAGTSPGHAAGGAFEQGEQLTAVQVGPGLVVKAVAGGAAW